MSKDDYKLPKGYKDGYPFCPIADYEADSSDVLAVLVEILKCVDSINKKLK